MDENKNEVVTDLDSFDGDVPAILPDGWQEGDTLIPEDSGDPDELFADGQEDDLDAWLAGLGEDDATAPTTGGESASAGEDAGAGETGAKPDGAAQPEVKPASRKLTLKVNHQEQEVDIAAMSDDELRSLLQRGYAFDALKDAEDRRTFLKAYQEQIDAGMTETVARLVAKDAAGGKAWQVKDGQIVEDEAPAKVPAVAPEKAPAQAPKPAPMKRDLRAEVEQFRMLFPNVKEVPDDVAKAVSKGIPLVTAYLAHRERESAKAAANLKKENKTLRQNAANAARAPVKGVSGGDTSPAKGQSIFEKAFDEGFEWA